MAKVKKNHKLVVEVEDVGGGECIVSARGTFTPSSSSVLLMTAVQCYMRSSNLSFDQIMDGLKEHIEREGHPFEHSEIVLGSKTN